MKHRNIIKNCWHVFGAWALWNAWYNYTSPLFSSCSCYTNIRRDQTRKTLPILVYSNSSSNLKSDTCRNRCVWNFVIWSIFAVVFDVVRAPKRDVNYFWIFFRIFSRLSLHEQLVNFENFSLSAALRLGIKYWKSGRRWVAVGRRRAFFIKKSGETTKTPKTRQNFFPLFLIWWIFDEWKFYCFRH